MQTFAHFLRFHYDLCLCLGSLLNGWVDLHQEKSHLGITVDYDPNICRHCEHLGNQILFDGKK